MGQPEKEIENAILEYLSFVKVFAWKNQSTGIWDPTKKVFRKSTNPYHVNGVADILGIYLQTPLAIEVKTPKEPGKAGGTLSAYQRRFLYDFWRNGGIAMVARNVDQVAAGLYRIKVWKEAMWNAQPPNMAQKHVPDLVGFTSQDSISGVSKIRQTPQK
jgi:hypothetical protein